MTKVILTFLVLLLASPSFAEVQNTQPPVPQWDQQAEERHGKCLAALESYFETGVSENAMKNYLVAQYEITVYRVFGSFLAQRRQQNMDVADGFRSKKAVTRYSDLIKELISAIEKTAQHNPEFQEAKRIFNDAPLSVAAFTKLAPFMEEYISLETTTYDNERTAILRLDRNDFKMLDVLVSVEKTTPTPGNFIEKIEHLDGSFIFNNELGLNAGLFSLKKIKKNMKRIVTFYHYLTVPPECIDEKNDLAIATGCYSCLQNKDESLYALTQMSDEINQLLFNSIMSREDLEYSRERLARQNLYYIGTDSPWGNYRD